MASSKKLSITHLVIALISGFMLISSFVNAGRAFDRVLPRDYTDDCNFLSVCKDGSDCTSQCEQQNFHDGGRCIDDPNVPQGLYCCCIAT
ncbi:hypothetical protein MKW94_000650 [Papaver nudicaule]|uniref:Uncharacterized protein n=1 Tax=Papaver nudicaule TaxID=74823 RepID=A0AA41VLK7_PAPNU|nr:hypothetical protein [Papaver nudicaule]